MHQREVIHRDIKLENIVMSMVDLALCRAWRRFATLDGQSTAPKNLDPPSAEHPSIFPLKCWPEEITIRKWTFGL